ncbi:squamous cell carcinoma antigen recognized by T-cells 3-like [Actinia tenebrosa]|uniref:Squamous cell carcinoma antigen recognized by T-cells 3-like n=1 Tax=Actinia tenebrosa TaxID=6105 RepID=A0A6P8IW49_ACTTE|nr:squamous cell carcinoma antigen recognized by T-cells 3-like [Actinia tenebrosa]
MAENMKMEDEMKTSVEQMEQDPSSSDEDEEDQEDDEEEKEQGEVEDPEIHRLELEIQANPYKYDSHVNLIDHLRSSGDLDKVREARRNMSEVFPLTEELWLQWIKDEIPLSYTPENKQEIISLIEKGVKDYQSVKLWIEYCQFIMDNMEGDDSISNVRNTFEKAITAAGLHVTEGSSIWDGYRDFEMAILDSFEQMLTDENIDSMEEKIASQRERIKSLFKRQLAIPLMGMQGTMRDFETWLEDDDLPSNVRQDFEKAEAKLEEILAYEDALASAKPPKLTEYRTYLEYELNKGDPVRIQCLYERALKENCLVGDLWIEYTGYLDFKLKMPSIAITVYERALRNCPWVSVLWQNYMKALERSKVEKSKIKDTLDKALTCGFTVSQDYLQLWHCYCSFLRRQVKDWNEGTLDEWDASYTRCHTRLTIVNERRAKAAEKEATKEAAQVNSERATAHEKKHSKGTKKDVKKLDKKSKPQNLKRKMDNESEIPKETSEPAFKKPYGKGKVEDNVQENNETVEEETREHKYERSSDPNKIFVSNLLFSITEEKLKNKFKELGEVQDVRIVKNKAGKSKGYAYVEFKDESPVPAALALDRTNMDGRPMFISPCVDKTKTPTSFKFATSLDKNTLFVSNLPFEIKESEVEQAFNKHGKVKQVRLVTTRAGKPKGYGYVEYEDENSASKAIMVMDGFILNDRTISVALSNPPSRKPSHSEPAAPPLPAPGSRGRSKTQVMLVPRALQKKSAPTSSTSSSVDETVEGKEEASKGFSNDYFRQLLQKK